jgi:hypothetical protein
MAIPLCFSPLFWRREPGAFFPAINFEWRFDCFAFMGVIKLAWDRLRKQMMGYCEFCGVIW